MTTAEPPPCYCATEEQAAGCRRSGYPMVGELYRLCRVSPAYRRLWAGLPAGPCPFLGEATGEKAECPPCSKAASERAGTALRVLVPVFRCGHPEHAAAPYTTSRGCATCTAPR